MSQSSTGSVRDFLPDNCFLNLDDDDEGTLNLVTKFTDTYFNRPLLENELDRANSDILRVTVIQILMWMCHLICEVKT